MTIYEFRLRCHWNCSHESLWQSAGIGSGDGLVPNRRQIIIWTNGDPVHGRMYAALGETSTYKTWDVPNKGNECEMLKMAHRQDLMYVRTYAHCPHCNVFHCVLIQVDFTNILQGYFNASRTITEAVPCDHKITIRKRHANVLLRREW